MAAEELVFEERPVAVTCDACGADLVAGVAPLGADERVTRLRCPSCGLVAHEARQRRVTVSAIACGPGGASSSGPVGRIWTDV